MLHHNDHDDKVKDVRVPEQLQRAMAAEAEAAREARAKVINIIIITIIYLFISRIIIIMIIIFVNRGGFDSIQVITAEGEQKASRALRWERSSLRII